MILLILFARFQLLLYSLLNLFFVGQMRENRGHRLHQIPHPRLIPIQLLLVLGNLAFHFREVVGKIFHRLFGEIFIHQRDISLGILAESRTRELRIKRDLSFGLIAWIPVLERQEPGGGLCSGEVSGHLDLFGFLD